MKCEKCLSRIDSVDELIEDDGSYRCPHCDEIIFQNRHELNQFIRRN